MKSKTWATLILLVTLVFTTPLWASDKEVTPVPTKKVVSAARPGRDYLIGPGDVLTISVWEVEALTKSVTVLPDGRIAFPLIGELNAAVKTIAELQEELEQKIAHFVPGPVVSVEVTNVNSMLIYLIGRVNNPGRFILNTNVNVLQALATAGGLNAFAKRSKIKIFRQQGEETKIHRFDYDEVSSGEEPEQNIVLRRGDVIVVP